jgi:hypothetical protein
MWDKIAALLQGEEVLWEVWPITYVFCNVMYDVRTMSFALLLASSVLSVTTDHLFSCINLLAIARQVKEMVYVLQVVRNNFSQLIKTLMFALIIIYIFAVVAYTSPMISDDTQILDRKPNALGPKSLLLHALFYWDYGFREGPVFTYSFAQKDVNSLEMPPDAFGHGAESLGLPESKINFPEVFAGVGFDLLYHLLIVLVFSAVVSGIIIDSFAELRAKKEEVRDDIVNTCFVCNIEREDFEQLNLPFIQHIKHEHNLWDYVFFRMYLESKESVDYSGLESYCFAQIREQKISWFPIKKAIIIEGRNKEKKDVVGLYRRLDHLNARMDTERNDREKLLKNLVSVIDDLRGKLAERS